MTRFKKRAEERHLSTPMVESPNQESPARVLVVSQQQSEANSIAECLSEAGYAVVTVRRYDDAVRTVGLARPDAAIVSAGNTEGDVDDLLRWLDGDPRVGGIPTVLVAPMKSLAGLARIVARKRSRSAYLIWPLKADDLRTVMQDLVRSDSGQTEPLSSNQLVLDPRLCILRGRAGSTTLTPNEYRLAAYLMREGHRQIAVQDLLTWVFGPYPGNASPALVWAHVSMLRQKIKIVTGGSNLIRVTRNGGLLFPGRSTCASPGS